MVDWSQGVIDFNEGRYWHAHEGWEHGWRKLTGPSKLHVQAMIQVVGVFVLLQKGRGGGALSLGKTALAKFETLRAEAGWAGGVYDLPTIPESEAALLEVVQALHAGTSCADVLTLLLRRELRAQVCDRPIDQRP